MSVAMYSSRCPEGAHVPLCFLFPAVLSVARSCLVLTYICRSMYIYEPHLSCKLLLLCLLGLNPWTVHHGRQSSFLVILWLGLGS